MLDASQKSEIKSIVIEVLNEILEREPRVLRENHEYVVRLREGERLRSERRRQLTDRVAGTVIIMTLLGLGSLIVAGAIEWVKGTLT